MRICGVCGEDVDEDECIGEVCERCAALHQTCGVYFILGSDQT